MTSYRTGLCPKAVSWNGRNVVSFTCGYCELEVYLTMAYLKFRTSMLLEGNNNLFCSRKCRTLFYRKGLDLTYPFTRVRRVR